MNNLKYCVANWKMNLTPTEGVNFIHDLKSKEIMNLSVKIILCPAYTGIVPAVMTAKETAIEIGSQNVYFESSGAYTGEISTNMLTDAGCNWVILGHSERRHVFGESDEVVSKKILKAMQDGLKPIICVGEKLEQREAGQTRALLKSQLNSAFQGLTADFSTELCVAYEPVWAIGTGKTATPQLAGEAHHMIREVLSDMGFSGDDIPVLYGGSVKPENAKELISTEGIDGFLIGGASLNVETFYQIYEKF